MTDRSDKTKEAIKHALIALMEREPFEVISVKRIVAASGVGRSTFYAYFEDKQDLLESIETELLEDLSLYRSRRSLAPTENPFDDMCKWYRTCYAWDRALRALTGPNGDPRFAGRLIAKASAELHDMMDFLLAEIDKGNDLPENLLRACPGDRGKAEEVLRYMIGEEMVSIADGVLKRRN